MIYQNVSHNMVHHKHLFSNSGTKDDDGTLAVAWFWAKEVKVLEVKSEKGT